MNIREFIPFMPLPAYVTENLSRNSEQRTESVPDQTELRAEAISAMRSLGTRATDAKRILDRVMTTGRTFRTVEEIIVEAYKR